MKSNIIYILIAALVTFVIRVTPLTLIRKPIKNKYIKAFLYYVPYVTISVMTFPAIVEATDSTVAGIAALVAGIVAAWFGASMFQVAVGCCILVFLIELVIIPMKDNSSNVVENNSIVEINTSIDKNMEVDMQDNVKLVYEYARQLISENNPKQAGEFTWDTERKKRSWTYYTGCMTDAFVSLYAANPAENTDFYNWTKTFYDNLIEANGNTLGSQYIKGELDSVTCGKPLIQLMKAEKSRNIEDPSDYSQTMAFIYDEICKQQNYPECGGNFIHKMNNNSWSHWNIALDGLYMAGTYLIDYAEYLEECGEREQADMIRSDVFNRLHWVAENLRMENGLYSHAYCVADGSINGISWLRSDGWYVMALVNAINGMSDTKMKETLIEDYKTFIEGVLPYQSESGIWYNIVDETTESFPGNYLETSGTAMFAYAMIKGYNSGFASEEYRDAGLKAFNGLCRDKITKDAAGKISINDIYMKSGVETEKALYLRHETLPNEAKGTAFVILSAVEVEKLLKNQ